MISQLFFFAVCSFIVFQCNCEFSFGKRLFDTEPTFLTDNGLPMDSASFLSRSFFAEDDVDPDQIDQMSPVISETSRMAYNKGDLAPLLSLLLYRDHPLTSSTNRGLAGK